MNDRPVTCGAFGPAVLSWEADGDRIVIPMVLLYMESRVGLISRKRRPNLPHGPSRAPPVQNLY